jgi:hypothetical protein
VLIECEDELSIQADWHFARHGTCSVDNAEFLTTEVHGHARIDSLSHFELTLVSSCVADD